MTLRIACFLAAMLWCGTALAWFDEGHMKVAALAYEQLTPSARAEANRLVRLNPDYPQWVAAIPHTPDHQPKDVDRYTFVRAAAWADDIKGYAAYRNASDENKDHKKDEATTAFAGRNIGYRDLLIHGYWHFKDIGFRLDGKEPPKPDPVDAVTQMKLFTAALPQSSGETDDVRSYDLVWLLHLVGDIHQPLHSVTLFDDRFTKKHDAVPEPDTGDRGGNEITVIPANGVSTNLHQYWDGTFGGYSTVFGALFDTFYTKEVNGVMTSRSKIDPPPANKAAISDPAAWAQESFELAKAYAYADPVLMGEKPELTREYETNARRISEQQVSLAAARLANLLNTALGGR
ncbi:phospholipase [Rhizobium sp. UPM1132]|uniref:S1/P1 nuclease n=1 Tax=Rhizobium ruizarguesonis TaxID=2081791 RepID=UPI0014481CBE|nr:S1/P1 nuclease [Rhizobium ruizarguesonis]NKQ73446.1 phospholipase [Rhizobium ruizarguesonis]